MKRGSFSPPPSMRNAPPREFQDEDVFAWIRRQNNPIKPATPTNKKARNEGQLARAMFEAINDKAEGTNK